MKPLFVPGQAQEFPVPLAGPEARSHRIPASCDANGAQFARNVENSQQKPRFTLCTKAGLDRVTDDLLSRDGMSADAFVTSRPFPNDLKNGALGGLSASNSANVEIPGIEKDPVEKQDPCWRQEVSRRLSNYKSRRRPRTPRYPSLQLKFDGAERYFYEDNQIEDDQIKNNRIKGVPIKDARISSSGEAPAPVSSTPPSAMRISEDTCVAPQSAAATGACESAGRLIEFPRSSTVPDGIPVASRDQLAEPVFDGLRIVETDETVPLPPAGGILMEAAETPVDTKRPGFDMPLQTARLGPRLLAAALDACVVLVALALSACIFCRVVWSMVAYVPPVRLAIVMAAGGWAVLWTAYQYLFIVYCGTTPGLKLAKVKLNRFDGSAALRRVRRWRILASILSGLSLGLGYAWCFLDEDQLCWHDRITRTYMAPGPQQKLPPCVSF